MFGMVTIGCELILWLQGHHTNALVTLEILANVVNLVFLVNLVNLVFLVDMVNLVFLVNLVNLVFLANMANLVVNMVTPHDTTGLVGRTV